MTSTHSHRFKSKSQAKRFHTNPEAKQRKAEKRNAQRRQKEKATKNGKRPSSSKHAVSQQFHRIHQSHNTKSKHPPAAVPKARDTIGTF